MDYSASQLNELISFLDGLPEPRIVMDADYRIVAANKAYRREYAGSGSGGVASILGHTPMGRFGEARELVGATLLLASERAGGFITGTELVVDGGFHATSI